MDIAVRAAIKQHLIDPETCMRCNTCEAVCPSGAITHDAKNYVVDPGKCRHSLACIPRCPTGAIDHWRTMPRTRAYTVQSQLGWSSLPEELTSGELAAEGVTTGRASAVTRVAPSPAASVTAGTDRSQYSATLPPWSAAHAYTHLYDASNPVIATVAGNMRVTEVGREYDTHHIVLDLGSAPFPVLEGQSIGVIPPGVDTAGQPHRMHQYSVSSPRDGERQGFNFLSLTLKRVLQDRQGNPVRGVASNYLCDLNVGDPVPLIGPFGTSFLMPNHPGSHIVMICTGTGASPMRAMLLRRYRQRTSADFARSKLMLFSGARTPEELPFFGRLHRLPKDFIDVNLAFSRVTGKPKHYVHDLMHARAEELAALLADENNYFYVCGLRSMEEGVVAALRDIAEDAGQRWDALAGALKREGRLHIETF